MLGKRCLLIVACTTFGGLVSGCSLFNKNSEQVVTLKVGPSWTKKSDVKVVPAPLIDGLEVKRVKFNTATAVGMGLELWSGSLPNLGLGFEVEHFKIRSPDQRVERCETVFGFSPEVNCAEGRFLRQQFSTTSFEFPLRARYGFVASDSYPVGRYQLFSLVGPAVFLSRYSDAGANFTPLHQSDTDSTVGVVAGAGVRYMITPNIDLSLEYRFKYFSPRFQVTDENAASPSSIRLNLASSQLLFGVSYHFNLFGRQ